MEGRPPSAAVAYLAGVAYQDMRPVGQLVAAGDRPDIEGPAAGRQSCMAAGEGCAACLVPLAEPSAVQHCVALQVSRQ